MLLIISVLENRSYSYPGWILTVTVTFELTFGDMIGETVLFASPGSYV